jgi:hypothetical protein
VPRITNRLSAFRQQAGSTGQVLRTCRLTKTLDGKRSEKMKLRDHEIAQAEKYLSQFEKDAQLWRWFRWFLLSMTIALLLLASWTFHKSKEAYDLNQTEGLLSGLVENSEVLEEFVDVKIGLLRVEFDNSLSLMFFTLAGGALGGYVIGRWGQERRHKLIAKCVRVVLASVCERTPSNNSSNTDAGDAGTG